MKRTFQAKLLILAVFLVGILTGAVLMDVYETRVFSDTDRSRRERPSFKEFLALTPAQATQVDAILEETRDDFRELRAQTRPQYDTLREESRNQIRELLTEVQKDRYDEWIELRRQRESDRRDRDR